jgi:hypothetical protein
VLEDTALIVREPDLFRGGRATYRITGPLITFYEAVMRRRWPELELGLADAVWPTAQRTFSAQVAGPHFEANLPVLRHPGWRRTTARSGRPRPPKRPPHRP